MPTALQTCPAQLILLHLRILAVSDSLNIALGSDFVLCPYVSLGTVDFTYDVPFE